MNLHVENLESRLVLTVYNVGPGQAYGALHDVPWDKVTAGDTVQVFWQATPYHDKIALNNSGTQWAQILIVGVPGPNGQLPVLDAQGAIENPQAQYWTTEVAAQGIFTVAPATWGHTVNWITIANLELTDALRDNWFINAQGQQVWYNWGASGVCLYSATNITIQNCIIHNNEDGIFGKSQGYANGDLYNITVRGNTIFDNGVANQDHYHNSYIEGICTVYEFNKYYAPKSWSAGCNIKDRGCGSIIRYNWVEGGVRLLDLVDPDDGAPTFLQDPHWGHIYVYGNILVNDPWGGASSMIHFGFDEYWANEQRNLHFYNNTVVNINDQTAGGRWYTYVFKCEDENQTIWAANNIFHSFSPKDGDWSGDYYLMNGGGRLYLGMNWIPTWTQWGDIYQLKGEQNLMWGEDPGFVDQKKLNFCLTKDSPCVVGGSVTYTRARYFVPKSVDYEFDYETGTWVPKNKTLALGAIG
jgi:hypothetical protein